MSSMLATFLGIERWKALWRAWLEATQRLPRVSISIPLLLVSCVLALLPVSFLYLESYSEATPTYLPTLTFGVCCVVGLVLRKRIGAAATRVTLRFNELSLTHTAVALGCIPAVCVVLLNPDLFSDRHEILGEVLPSGRLEPGAAPNYPLLVATIFSIAAWVAVTEEVIFRGVLLSALRRALFTTQWNPRTVDTVAILCSALLFGVAHIPSWGFGAGFALFGLGVGFGIAYVVTDEKLLAVIGYHFVFDVLSLSLAMLL